MSFERCRPLTAALSLLALTGLGPWALEAEAQYFGRNKVQYEDFDFKVLRTEHFDIHYYPEMRDAAEQAARMAERWYARLSRVFNHELSDRQVVIFYADHPDFEQTTVLSGFIDEATGGVTEAFKRRMVLPMAGSLAETDHVLGHEMVHAFQFDITTTTRSALGGGFPAALQLPLWFIEGMAEYLSLGPVYPLTAMWMHDAARREELPSFRDLGNPKYNPYRYGHALWAYIGGRWGDPVVGELLKAAAATGSPGQAISNVLGTAPADLVADWQEATNEAYEGVLARTKLADAYGEALISKDNGGNLNIAPTVSPDGSQLVFLSEKSRLNIEMFLADAETGKVERRILKTAIDPHYESLQFINSAGDWHPDSRHFVFAGISKGKPILTVIDTERGKATQEFKLSETGEIFNPAFSPDGRFIVYSASVGGLMDLFVLDRETGERRRLTEDPYADLQPVWSPDGRWIAFVTDRFTTDIRSLAWGNYRIGLIDPETGTIRQVPDFADGKNINPQWSGDGALYFISDQNGISNIYRIDLDSDAVYQVTQLTTGASGITSLSPAMSLAKGRDRLVFSVFEGDRYTIYAAESPEVLAGGPVEPPIGDTSPAVLPPEDRPVGDVMALVSNADLGLPASTDEFETRDYSAGLSLDYIAPPQVAVGASSYGTFVGGGTALFWSDILGHHNLATLLQVNGSFQDIAAVVSYQNLSSRLNWGVAGAQIPILTRRFGLALTPDGNLLEQELRLRQTNREISALLSYPFSRVQRVEFSGGYQNITFSNELRVRTFSPSGRELDEEEIDFPSCDESLEAFCEPSALNLVSGTAALVYDNAVFGFTGPILGQRYRFEAAPVFGSLNFVGALGDFRRYLMPFSPYTLAARVLHFGRYGSDGEDFRLFPLFLGYQQIVRGYDAGSFGLFECGAGAVDSGSFAGENSSCPAFDQLFGSRLLVGNFELRIPIPQGFGVPRPAGLPPLTLALFYDVGAAWWTSSTAREIGGNLDPWNPVSSYGVAARVNLFGVALLEIDFVHPNNRPEKGWFWQFGFSPGF